MRSLLFQRKPLLLPQKSPFFHIQMDYEFRRLRLEVKSAVNRLKDLIILSQEFLQQLEEQRISSKMFDKLSA